MSNKVEKVQIMAEEKVVRVFISSTINDLQKERQTVKDVISDANSSLRVLGIFLNPIDLQQGAS